MINCAVNKVEAWSFWCEKNFFLNLSIEWSSANDILLPCTFWINLEQTLLRWWKFFKVITKFFNPCSLRVQNWRLKNCTFGVALLLYSVLKKSFLEVGVNRRSLQRFKITRGTRFKTIFSFCNGQEVIQGVTNACKDKIQQKIRTFWICWTRHLNLNFDFLIFFLNSKNGKSILEKDFSLCLDSNKANLYSFTIQI